MTRINCGIPPKALIGKHLLAEHREIKRIPNNIQKGKYSMNGIPNEFTLGKGHCKFFYDKLGYLQKRYESLYYECLRRGYNVTYYGNAWDNIPSELMNDYQPTSRDKDIIWERIKSKLITTDSL
jgi:hypothetical protein